MEIRIVRLGTIYFPYSLCYTANFRLLYMSHYTKSSIVRELLHECERILIAFRNPNVHTHSFRYYIYIYIFINV